MGCDAYADDDGVFEIEIRDYEATTTIRREFYTRVIRIENLTPGRKIALEVTKGEER